MSSHLQLNSPHVLAHGLVDDSCELLHVHPNLRLALTDDQAADIGPAARNIGDDHD